MECLNALNIGNDDDILSESLNLQNFATALRSSQRVVNLVRQ